MKNIENKFINAGGKAMRSYGSQDYPLVLQGPGVYVKCGDELTLIAGSGEGGGLMVDWDKIQGKPSWIGPNKPTYTKADVGLDQVDNTSDKDKPVSTATQTALNLKLDKSVWDDNFKSESSSISALKDMYVNKSLIVKDEIVTYSLDGIVVESVPAVSGFEYLYELLDTSITSPVSNQYLKYNGSKWINASINYDDITNKPSAVSLEWNNINNKPSTFTPSAHKHAKADITDFPSSMPASDVYTWAKAANKPGYTAAEVGARSSTWVPGWNEVTGKPSSFTPSAHTHSISDVSSLQSSLNDKVSNATFTTHTGSSSAHNATSSNTGSRIVLRDSSGNFSAGTITASLSGNASSATKLATARTLWGQSFDGTGNVSGAITDATTGSFSSSVDIGGNLTVKGETTTYGIDAISFSVPQGITYNESIEHEIATLQSTVNEIKEENNDLKLLLESLNANNNYLINEITILKSNLNLQYGDNI